MNSTYSYDLVANRVSELNDLLTNATRDELVENGLDWKQELADAEVALVELTEPVKVPLVTIAKVKDMREFFEDLYATNLSSESWLMAKEVNSDIVDCLAIEYDLLKNKEVIADPDKWLLTKLQALAKPFCEDEVDISFGFDEHSPKISASEAYANWQDILVSVDILVEEGFGIKQEQEARKICHEAIQREFSGYFARD